VDIFVALEILERQDVPTQEAPHPTDPPSGVQPASKWSSILTICESPARVNVEPP
jgi:hypothetical protein